MTAYFVGYAAAARPSSVGAEWLRDLRISRVITISRHNAQQEDPPKAPTGQALNKAIAAIVNLIPAEGIAFYVAAYGLAVGIYQEGPLRLILGFAVVAAAVGLNILSVVLGARSGAATLSGPPDRKSVVKQGILVSALLLIYIAVQPGNPFELFLHIPTALMFVVALLLNTVIGMIAARP